MEMEMLRRVTPEEEYTAGLALYRAGGVHAIDEENGMLRYVVDDNPRRVVRVGAGGKLSGRCSCDFFGNVHKPCRHLAAAMMQAMAGGALEEARRRKASSCFLKSMSPMLLPDICSKPVSVAAQ